jgi:hypothetical protein
MWHGLASPVTSEHGDVAVLDVQVVCFDDFQGELGDLSEDERTVRSVEKVRCAGFSVHAPHMHEKSLWLWDSRVPCWPRESKVVVVPPS